MLDTSWYVDDMFYGMASIYKTFILSSGTAKTLGEANKSNSTCLKTIYKEHEINIEEDTHEQIFSKLLGRIWVTENNTLKLNIQLILVGIDNVNIPDSLFYKLWLKSMIHLN